MSESQPDTPPRPLSGPMPRGIDKERYPALEEMRKNCHVGGRSLLDRIYTEAMALHRRAVEAEAELELLGVAPTKPTPTVYPRAFYGSMGRQVAPKRDDDPVHSDGSEEEGDSLL